MNVIDFYNQIPRIVEFHQTDLSRDNICHLRSFSFGFLRWPINTRPAKNKARVRKSKKDLANCSSIGSSGDGKNSMTCLRKKTRKPVEKMSSDRGLSLRFHA